MAAIRRSPRTLELNDGHYRVDNWIVESNAPAIACALLKHLLFPYQSLCRTQAHQTSDQPLHCNAITNNTLQQVVGGRISLLRDSSHDNCDSGEVK